ncbi:TGACG-sequence-specific DNA-binding protein TGA-2.1 [Castilleja foliolosa]|uniref:TGACG-sequence-specific DNA-binding protein TGA-2.1 n=1 Tax=Castilleja foliolosa TaxID=1961234 RepID=A0ABD3D8B1_9LAMI
MDITTIKFGAEANKSVSSGIPSFISQPPVLMVTEGNGPQLSQTSDFGVLEQYLGYRFGEPANISRSPLFNPPANSQIAGHDIQSNAFKALASTNTNISAGLVGSQLQKGPQVNLVSATGAQLENWGESNMAAESSSRTDTSNDMDLQNQKLMGQSTAVAVSDSSDKSKEKTPNQKTQRRLAQNREAARKSRLRKKAYVQQLENSRLKLSQLEQELQRARQQGIFISNSGDQSHAGTANGALAFDAEYARWTEDQNRRINELRTAISSHIGDTELCTIVENVSTHFNEIYKLKGNAAKTDAFHILSGMWKTPAERCFMWIGGFRPSELLKLLISHLEPLTEQQLSGVYNLRESSHQAEDALSQGMDALQQSLAETLANSSSGPVGPSGNVANYMGQMAMAMGKLGSLEGFLRQLTTCGNKPYNNCTVY